MKFDTSQLREAVEHSADGHQALHLHRVIVDRSRAPRCFVQAVDRGEQIAHLFDMDRDRLVKTARKLGVRVVYIDRAGTRFQHIDLCGQPLRRAVEMCEEVS